MNICLVTPAAKNANNGNRTSALRWARLLRAARHRVQLTTAYDGRAVDLLIALHAWRSAASVRRYRERYPRGPLLVALGGTDVNTFLQSDPQVTLSTLRSADALVGLHDLIGKPLPAALRAKLRVIYQSALPLPQPRRPSRRGVEVFVIGHLRDEKDPLRAALAARRLPPASRLRVRHFGKATSPEWRRRARAEADANPRYRWHGETPRWRLRRRLSGAHAMVISSLQEGGANVVSEAVAAGVPVLASRIDGNVGLLGDDYAGYFPPGDDVALAELLWRFESDAELAARLSAQGRTLQRKFTPEREAAAWRQLIAELSAAA